MCALTAGSAIPVDDDAFATRFGSFDNRSRLK
jgi:hypothetical protein